MHASTQIFKFFGGVSINRNWFQWTFGSWMMIFFLFCLFFFTWTSQQCVPFEIIFFSSIQCNNNTLKTIKIIVSLSTDFNQFYLQFDYSIYMTLLSHSIASSFANHCLFVMLIATMFQFLFCIYSFFFSFTFCVNVCDRSKTSKNFEWHCTTLNAINLIATATNNEIIIINLISSIFALNGGGGGSSKGWWWFSIDGIRIMNISVSFDTLMYVVGLAMCVFINGNYV